MLGMAPREPFALAAFVSMFLGDVAIYLLNETSRCPPEKFKGLL